MQLLTLSAFTLLAASFTSGSPIQADSAVEARAVLIASTAYYACNAPHNGGHKAGDSCKYYDGPSTKSTVIHGTCKKQNGQLTCVKK